MNSKLLVNKIEDFSRIKTFILIILIILINDIFYVEGCFRWDSAEYANLSKQFGEGVTFNFEQINLGIRGYFFPLLLNIIFRIPHAFGVPESVYYCFISSIIYGFVLVYAFPILLKRVYQYEVKNSQILTFTFLLLLFYGGYLYSPLCDVFAGLSIVIAVVVLFSKYKFDFLISGLLIAIAVNMRPSYMYLFYAFVVAVFMIVLMQKIKLFEKLFFITVFVIGFLIISFPQFIINKQNQYQSFFPNVKIQYHGKDIILLHLEAGIRSVKYETLILNDKPKVFYKTPHALEVLQPSQEIGSIQEYVHVFKSNFLKVAGIYSLHFLFGSYIGTNHAYPHKHDQYPYFFLIINALLWTIVTIAFVNKQLNFKSTSVLLILILTMLSIVTVLPVLVETRYFVLMHLVMIMITANSLTKGDLKSVFYHTKSLLVFGLFLSIFLIQYEMLTAHVYMIPITQDF
jgi:hypothetical protein